MVEDALYFWTSDTVLGKAISSGGRVLNFVSVSDNYLECRNEAIKLIEKLNWKNGFYRSDIGFKVIDQWE